MSGVDKASAATTAVLMGVSIADMQKPWYKNFLHEDAGKFSEPIYDVSKLREAIEKTENPQPQENPQPIVM